MIFARRFGYYLLLRRAKIFGHRSQNNAPCCFVHCVRIPFLFSPQNKTERRLAFRFVFWRRERDSNPRVLSHKLISSQPRYDHFDISPYMIKFIVNLIFVVYLAGRPVMSRCGARNLLLAIRFAKFRPRPLRLLAVSATGNARKRPHFDTSAYVVAFLQHWYYNTRKSTLQGVFEEKRKKFLCRPTCKTFL